MNVVDRKDDKVKVLIYSPAVLDEMAKMVEKVSEGSEDKETNHPKHYDVAIVRTGTTRHNTRYVATPIADQPFEAGNYTPYNLGKLNGLTPMPPQEMAKYKGQKPPVATTTAAITTTTRKPKDAQKPVSSVVPTVDMENTLTEDDDVV